MAHVLGLMSGTSIDGIDLAHIDTDGMAYARPVRFHSYNYDPVFREKLRACFGKSEGRADPHVLDVERQLTELHARVVNDYLKAHALSPDQITLIGFHGQTIWHRPQEGVTIQLGDGALLAQLTRIPVVNDFRSADVAAGGQGAPLVPLYHRARAISLPLPMAIVNIGGVSNITWIGGESDDEILAFDLGPGSAMIDDWMLRHFNRPYDRDGEVAGKGTPDADMLARFMAHPYFAIKPPKSLDRDAFTSFVPAHQTPLDGAATLTRMTAEAIAQGLSHLPRLPRRIYITGGGRNNGTLLSWLADISKVAVSTVDELGWSGDAMEAEAFAYLAMRSHIGLSLTVPGTTGVSKPTKGGIYHGLDSAE